MNQNNILLENKGLSPDRVVVVEDDAVLLKVIQKALNEQGFVTEGFMLGKDAINWIEENPAALLLLDYRLPDMTGRDVIGVLNDRKIEIPFISMTAYSDDKVVIDMMKLGARDYLLKEGNFIDLIPQVVRQTIEQIATEKKLEAAEVQLRENEKQYRLLFERDLAGNFYTTIDGSILDCNESFARIFGYSSREEILQRNALDLYLDEEERYVFIEKLLKDKALLNYECCLRRKDGSPVWILENIILVEGENASASTIQGTMIDITERKMTEKALRTSEELNRGIVSAAPIGITYLDHDGTIIYENPVMARIIGATDNRKSSLIGKKLQQIPSIVEAGGVAIFNRLLSQEKIEGEEIEFRSLDDTWKTLQIHGALRLGADDEIKGAVLMFLDITEYRTLEEQFRQSQKMEAIGQLAGGIAHDFNNLLTAVIGHAELARRTLDLNDPLSTNLYEIQKAGERAASLTQQLLAFSRKQILEPKIVNINSIIQKMDTMLRRIIGEDVELVTVANPDLWTIKVDPGQIEQVILNLAVNARDAMPDGGKLMIETKNNELDDEYILFHPEVTIGNYVLLSISDTGCGMTEEVKAQIFDPFFTTKETGKGTGLGLSTVYGIVKQSGGYIRVYSEVDKGTKFKINLPKVEGKTDEAQSDTGRLKPMYGNEKVLVVEDEDALRDLVVTTLKEFGYNVFSASDGIEAFKMCDETDKPFDLIITDLIMPNMCGSELAKQVRKYWSDIKMLYISGYSADTITEEGELGSDIPYIQKPFRLSTFTEKVREVLDQ